MNVDLVFKIAAVGIIVAILNSLLSKSGRDEQALMVTIAGACGSTPGNRKRDIRTV